MDGTGALRRTPPRRPAEEIAGALEEPYDRAPARGTAGGMTRLEDLVHRADIGELLARYARAVDEGEWDLLDTVFTADAEIDLSSTGGPKGTREQVKAWLAETLPSWPGRQHLLGPASVSFDERGASVRAPFTDTLSPSREMVRADASGLIRGGGVYHHTLVRAPDGWRSRAMRLEQQWRTIS
ncbi:nuclear transport factor 2 family protein [Actinomadura parmotrematis]|uniref:Nuclear transport factor 2 family protein n=1 Tax=Actinomadura parmotrematis TaxID=2864039 RepID=A0ABS7FST8_9ACTN|nr:nuclear transport factor 2 family protein [Actinomadura parmotrematis]MBW8482588.1 nuclear transport factor 2 family protein [Actinomadura parmotrematis]